MIQSMNEDIRKLLDRRIDDTFIPLWHKLDGRNYVHYALSELPEEQRNYCIGKMKDIFNEVSVSFSCTAETFKL